MVCCKKAFEVEILPRACIGRENESVGLSRYTKLLQQRRDHSLGEVTYLLPIDSVSTYPQSSGVLRILPLLALANSVSSLLTVNEVIRTLILDLANKDLLM
jgi:hypothetical protein